MFEVGKEYTRKDGKKVRFLGEINHSTPLIFAAPTGANNNGETLNYYKKDGTYPTTGAQNRKYDILTPFPSEAEASVIAKMKRVLGSACHASDEDLLDIVRELKQA